MKNNQQNHTEAFLYLTQAKLFFFSVLVQLLYNITFLAPPLSKLHTAISI